MLLSKAGDFAANNALDEAQGTMLTRLRTKLSSELVAAPGDLEQSEIKFVMLEFSLVL